MPPYESADGAPELAARYPLAMISPPARNFLNSTFVNVESLRSTEGEPQLDIHPPTRTPRGIADGDQVRIFNDRGSMQARARVTDKTRDGLVVGLSIWWKKLVARRPQRQRGHQPGAHRSGRLGHVLRLPGRGRTRLKTRSKITRQWLVQRVRGCESNLAAFPE